MAQDNQAAMPSSQGGLMQYYDADSGIELDPKLVVAASLGIAVIELGLHAGIFF